ncbi:glutamate ABC transporter substrate-binding protein [Streptomyces sp. NPDC050433]|uniref:glutamate ABC transporter substrate-binding protein n=1 Tax=unclassified Streptomyces TaxID=2593676 RepID=UPI0034342CF0
MKADTTQTHESHQPSGSPGTGGRPTGRRTGVTVAAVVALAATLSLLPLSRDDRAEDRRESRKVAAEAAPAAEAADCEEPERSLRPSSADGPTIAKIKARGHLIVGIDQSSYRWGYRDPATKTIEGFDIDLARAIAENILGSPKDIVFRAIPTNQRVDALNTDTDSGVDLVVRTMTINCARIEQVAFSTAYFEAGQQILAPREQDGTPITGYDESLSGKRVCSADSTTAYDELVKNSYGAIFEDEHDGTPQDEDILTVPNQLDCLVRLQMGEVDAIVTDNALAAGQAAQDPAVELVGKPFTTEYYGVAAKLGNDDLVRRVNQVLVEYRAGGADSLWMKSYTKWLAAGLPGIKAPPEAKYKD